MIDGHNGIRYIAASDIRLQDGYEDVTPALLRTWVADGRLELVTVGELATALGRAVPAGIDPTAPAQARGASGPENVYRWPDVVRVETATRQHRREHGGRPRGRAPRLVTRYA
jgi:hypothetical protein